MTENGGLSKQEMEAINISPDAARCQIPSRIIREITNDRPETAPLVSCRADGCKRHTCWLCHERDQENSSPIFTTCKLCRKIRCVECITAAFNRQETGEMVVRCCACYDAYCGDCADVNWLPRNGRRDNWVCWPCYQAIFRYWSAKPCTNPTKRCGDCHRQRVMRSSHMEECAKMMKKREARMARSAKMSDDKKSSLTPRLK